MDLFKKIMPPEPEQKQRVLVLGAKGMAGHVVAEHLTECGYMVTTLARSSGCNFRLDVEDWAGLGTLMYAIKDSYDVIINCIGMLVESCEKNQDRAICVNSWFPKYLESRCTNYQTKIIHLSTDCVFSGSTGMYSEDSNPDGQGVYSQSKSLGEINNNKDLTFRMSIIGPELKKNGTGLFHWFMNQKGKISGFENAIWNGITTIELAKAIDSAIQQDLTGLYHLVPDEIISKYSLLNMIKLEFDRQIDIDLSYLPNKIDKTLLNSRSDFDFQVSGYQDMIAEMKQWIENRKTIYDY